MNPRIGQQRFVKFCSQCSLLLNLSHNRLSCITPMTCFTQPRYAPFHTIIMKPVICVTWRALRYSGSVSVCVCRVNDLLLLTQAGYVAELFAIGVRSFDP